MIKTRNKYLIFLMKDIQINLNFKYSLFFQLTTPIFYLTMFFYISKYITETSSFLGNSYFLYVSIGICMIDALSTIVNSQSREIMNMKASGVIEEIVFLDKNIGSTLVAISIYSVVFSIIKIIIYITLISFFSGVFILNLENIFLFILTLIVLLISFVYVGVLGGIYALRFHKIGFIPLSFMVISIIFGNAYFPNEILPDYIQKISYLTSFSYGIENFRLLLTQNIVFQDIINNIIFIIILSFMYYLLGYLFIKKSINKIKKSGNLDKF